MQRSEYTTIDVDPDLLIQVLQELFAMASDPNDIEVTDAEHGRVILAHPELAEAWYQKALAHQNGAVEKEPEVVAIASTSEKEFQVLAESTTEPEEVVAIANTSEKEEDAPAPPPVKRGPGRPPKSSYTSASNGEEP